MENELLRIGSSPARRTFLLVCMAVLGVLLVWLGFSAAEGGLLIQVILIGLGVLTLAGLPRFYRAASRALILVEAGLVDSDGTMICEIENIASVERGTFAFRPSNGFMIRTKESGAFGWEPGMWWRIGKRLGVGGILNVSQTKLMADMLTAQIHRG